MAVPQTFYIPWSEIDPNQQHGGLPGELAGFVGPRLGDNPRTRNHDVRQIFDTLRDCSASLSMHPRAQVEGPPDRGMVTEVLDSITLIMERTIDRTRAMSNTFFTFVHATPPSDPFTLRPIQYPLRNPFMHDAVYWMLGTMAECAELNANGFHTGLDPQSSHRIVAPLYHLKANLIRDYFDQEVAGEISPSELAELVSGLINVNIVLPGDTQATPDPNAVEEALQGVSLIQWMPGEDDWQIFGQKLQSAYTPERIWQPEGNKGTTEDVAAENPVNVPI